MSDQQAQELTPEERIDRLVSRLAGEHSMAFAHDRDELRLEARQLLRLLAAPSVQVERPDEPADDAICRCGHTAHWHAAVVYEGESGEGPLKVPQGAGGCEERSEDGSLCGCEQFAARLPKRPDEGTEAA